MTNPNYWGCSLFTNVEDQEDLPFVQFPNATLVRALGLGISKSHEFLDFVDDDGTYTAILAPKTTVLGVDWRASSFGVSSQCRALRNDSCEIEFPRNYLSDVDDVGAVLNCSLNRAGVDISAQAFRYAHSRYYFDGWHRDLKEPPPFTSVFTATFTVDVLSSTGNYANFARNLSDQESSSIFSNPWRTFSITLPFLDRNQFDLITPYDVNSIIWSNGSVTSFMLYDCNITGLCSKHYTPPGLTATSLGR
jgi:hypothetical protein